MCARIRVQKRAKEYEEQLNRSRRRSRYSFCFLYFLSYFVSLWVIVRLSPSHFPPSAPMQQHLCDAHPLMVLSIAV